MFAEQVHGSGAKPTGVRWEGTDTAEGNKKMSDSDREHAETKTGLRRERMDGYFHSDDREHFPEEVITDSRSERFG